MSDFDFESFMSVRHIAGLEAEIAELKNNPGDGFSWDHEAMIAEKVSLLEREKGFIEYRGTPEYKALNERLNKISKGNEARRKRLGQVFKRLIHSLEGMYADCKEYDRIVRHLNSLGDNISARDTWSHEIAAIKLDTALIELINDFLCDTEDTEF